MVRALIVGSGVVGTATGKGLLRHGHAVQFIDIDNRRIDALQSEGLAAGDHIDLQGGSAYIFLTLPTPSNGSRYDLAAFIDGTKAVGHALRDASTRHTVVVRSTVPPGTTSELVEPLIAEVSGQTAGDGFTVASNPEFLRANCALDDFLNPWMTVIGCANKRTRELLTELYAPFGGELRTFDDPRTTEFIKCAHNIFNAAKISFWNEMGLIAGSLDLDIREIAETVARSAEGSINIDYGIRAGAPYRGACLPKDTTGFLGFAQDLGVPAEMLEATISVNKRAEAAAMRDDLTIDLTEIQRLPQDVSTT